MRAILNIWSFYYTVETEKKKKKGKQASTLEDDEAVVFK